MAVELKGVEGRGRLRQEVVSRKLFRKRIGTGWYQSGRVQHKYVDVLEPKPRGESLKRAKG